MKTRGIIAAGNPATARAAAEILQAGGNAFDAAVAGFFTTMVAEPAMSSPGGGGFMTGYTAAGKPLLYDFFVQTPQKKLEERHLDFFPIEIDFGTASETFHVGLGSCAVPGSIAGALEIARDLGQLPLSEVLAPAIRFAREGALVDDFQQHDLHLLTNILSLDPLARPLFFKNGSTLKEGDQFVMPGLASLFEALVREGADFFYKGELMQQMVRQSQEGGGMLTRQDFAAYQVIRRQPLSINYRGHTLLTNPLPSIGGSLIALGLAQLEKEQINFAPHSREQVVALQKVLSWMDTCHQNPEMIISQLEKLGLTTSDLNPKNEKRGSTTHFNILDEHGNAASVTTTNGEGCGKIVKGWDFMLNNMLGEAALLPSGFHSWNENVRLSSMMAPTIMLNPASKPEVVLGTGGAGRIPGAIVQVLHYLLDHKTSVHAAANGPRMHWHKGTFNLEAFFPAGIPDFPELKQLVWWKDYDMFFGGVHTILSRDGKMTAAGDARRSGVVQVVE
ncbi:MAG: gamma-glutamyltransferase [Bacteroidia bacterium]|nr:gamma-glutamyltransferase [Bacteroidia bacterium]